MRIDDQLARFFYATNTPFLHVEHEEFKKLCTILRPGYEPPNRKAIAESLLGPVHESVVNECKQEFDKQTVTMALDGWSNVHNEPIVCCSIVGSSGKYALVDTIDTSGNSHDADYLTKLALSSIKVSSNFGFL
jgi:hypothetical protein